MKKLFIALLLTISTFGPLISGCGDAYLCCGGVPGYFVSNATCVNGVPVDCQWTPCPEDPSNTMPEDPYPGGDAGYCIIFWVDPQCDDVY